MKKTRRILTMLSTVVAVMACSVPVVYAVEEDPNIIIQRPIWTIDEFPIGDATMDGVINIRDCAKIASEIASGNEKKLSDIADYNEDGNINIRDAAAIAKYLAEN